MNEMPLPPSTPPQRWVWLLTGAIVIAALLLRLGPGISVVYHADELSEQQQSLNGAKAIGQALGDFHRERGTDTAPFPSDIHQLEEMGYISHLAKQLELRQRFAGDWLYFSMADSENPRAPLLISPPIGQMRVVLSVDGTVWLVEPALTDALIKESPTEATRVPSPIKGK